MTEPAGLGEVVGHHDDGLFQRSENIAQVGLKLGADHGVKRGQGLVQQDHLGVEHQGAHQAHSLALAAGELGGETVESVDWELSQVGELGESTLDPLAFASRGIGPSGPRCLGHSNAGKGRHPE